MTQGNFDFDKLPDSPKPRIKKTKCPHCNHVSIEYRRSMNSNMAIALICLLKSNEFDYVHMEELLRLNGYKRCGDFSYLVHYRFLEKLKEKRDDGSSKNGKYKITSAGIMFAEGKTTCKSTFIMEEGVFKGFDGKDITIKDALGEKFNYDQLMQNI